ncbi:MAG: hypothetical protein AB1607_09625 [Chloroflexota bacterium]
MDIVTAISITISIAAFILSTVALWQTHFAKSKLVNTVGNLQIRLYFLQHKKEKWYLPTIEIPISLTNEGARVGKVLGLRVRVWFPDLPDSQKYQLINPLCEVDYKKFDSMNDQLFEWTDEAVLGEWMPFTVLPKQTVTKHWVFQSRWDEVIIQDNVIFELEIFTNVVKKWRKIAKWKATLSPEMWNTSIRGVSSFVFMEANSEALTLENNNYKAK